MGGFPSTTFFKHCFLKVSLFLFGCKAKPDFGAVQEGTLVTDTYLDDTIAVHEGDKFLKGCKFFFILFYFETYLLL